MEITNKLGMNPTLFEIIKKLYNSYDKVGWRSVTGLLKPVQMSVLEERHWKDLTVDVSELTWLWFGTLGHAVAEANPDVHAISEQRFIYQHLTGKGISFKPDIMTRDPDSFNEFILEDFKFTSVYALKDAIKGKLKEEWIKQLNLYKFMLGELHYTVNKMKLNIIARDHRGFEALQQYDYPKNPIGTFIVPDWGREKAMQFLDERVAIYIEHENTPDDELPECSTEERWSEPTQYCVCKKEAKRTAVGNLVALPKAKFLSVEKAQEFLDARKDKDLLCIDTRVGMSRRCEMYCPVRHVCKQFHKISNPF